MNRFRRKSDAKRSQAPGFHYPSDSQELLSELPAASSFRTSLILPDLTRRFTLLRTPAGDPVSLSDLRTRFADQRARGAEHQISEEEEDMILETLGRMRSKNMGSGRGNQGESPMNGGILDSGQLAADGRQSTQSSSPLTLSSASSSPSVRSTKRYSNNLFGSGRFRDYTYMRSVASQKPGSSRSVVSLKPTDSSSTSENISNYSENARSVTPDSTPPSSSIRSSQSEKPAIRSAPLAAPAPYNEQPVSTVEYRLSKSLGPLVLKRASIALEQAIKEIEEEAEDQIVMPRFNHVARNLSSVSGPLPEDVGVNCSHMHHESQGGAGTAISSNKQPESEASRISPTPYVRPGTTSPTPRLPGYIPGMPRPMTPRDLFTEEDRSHSTTPRATSPTSTVPPNSTSSSTVRDSSQSLPRSSVRPSSPSTSTPLFLPRSPTGRFSPENHQRAGESTAIVLEHPSNSSIAGRRRPVSPLAGSAFQAMSVSSRPSTPSNVTWNPSISSHTQQSADSNEMLGHKRDKSWVSESSIDLDVDERLERSRLTSRSLRSPALPDSPLVDNTHISTSSWSSVSVPITPDPWPSPSISDSDFNQSNSVLNRIPRSPTPTQIGSVSPTSPTFPDKSSNLNGSRRSSKQNGTTSPFAFGSTHPLVFSPLANSSRSSLESAGSSYHSWDEDRRKDRYLALFADVDPLQEAWHDLSATDKSHSTTPGSSQDGAWDAGEIISRYASLTKVDFAAIQEKLVSASIAKNTTPELRDRAPSLRRRRPSTSQSNYSLNGRDNRVASPSMQAQNSTATSSRIPDNVVKASALLDSVVDSIHSPKNLTANGSSVADVTVSPEVEAGSPSQRNRELARALFGGQDRKGPPPMLSLPPVAGNPMLIEEQSPDASYGLSIPPPDATTASSGASPHFATPPPDLTRSHSTSKNLTNHVELVKEVQRKADAAMVALKRTPSNHVSDPVGTNGSVSRRHISPNQISTPRLVSASTSVDTIPLRSPSVGSGNAQGSLKIGHRIRRLRGTLRAKTPTNSDEVTPYPLDLRSPPPVQVVQYDPASLHPSATPGAASATELGPFKVPVPVVSPPASAGPGLRGFMARFRKQRGIDSSTEHDRHNSPRASPAFHDHGFAAQPEPSQQNHSASMPAFTKPVADTSTDDTMLANVNSAHTAIPEAPSSVPASVGPVTPVSEVPQPITDDENALKQLFRAASNLGLDPAALNDLLNNSTTNSTRSNRWTGVTQHSLNNSTSTVPDAWDESHRANPPPVPNKHPIPTTLTNPLENATRKALPRPPPSAEVRSRNDNLQGGTTINAIVRRTIIFPSETRASTADLNILIRKGSQSSRRQRPTSGVSVSSRSVHDRAPTPPPSRATGGRRFSTDTSPPVPQLPASFSSQAENLLQGSQPVTATGPIEKSSSTYDSLYDMYSGEQKESQVPNDPSNRDAISNEGLSNESGPAVEVIELASGETIWSIVNGLRDDDTYSNYGSRASFASDFSTRDANGDGVQVFFKEQGRAPSRNNVSSMPLSRKKSVQSKSRPETKVFYSSSAQIGRLIENLSQGREAGSFNFKPNHTPSHSHSSSVQSGSELNWSVEERLEHMLGSMSAT